MNRKSQSWIIGWCLFLCLALVFPTISRADFGSYAGDSDFGGSSWDSGSSWDNESSWSSGGSTWDDDDYSSGSGSDNMTVGGMLPVIIIIGVFMIIWFSNRARNRRRGSGSVPAGGQRTSDAQLLSLDGYVTLDPKFNKAAFTEKLSNLYVQMQNSWQNGNIESVRPFFTDAMYSQMDRQLAGLRRNGYTNFVERIAVLGVLPRGYYQSGGYDHIVAELRARIVDYTMEDRTGKLISGDPKREKFMTYEWDLVRPSGMVTDEGNALSSVRCPNCGAPLAINQSAKCSYCGSVVSVKKHDWAIYAIKGISQETR